MVRGWQGSDRFQACRHIEMMREGSGRFVMAAIRRGHRFVSGSSSTAELRCHAPTVSLPLLASVYTANSGVDVPGMKLWRAVFKSDFTSVEILTRLIRCF